MNLNWVFAMEAPLPAGLEIETLAAVPNELGDTRTNEAVALLGREAARAIANKVGPYQLEEEIARRLELEGLKLGEEGEFKALTPSTWGKHPNAESWSSFTMRLSQSGAEIRGLRLTQERRFFEISLPQSGRSRKRTRGFGRVGQAFLFRRTAKRSGALHGSELLKIHGFSLAPTRGRVFITRNH